MLQEALSSISSEELRKAFLLIKNNLSTTLYTMGNGGSAAIAEHFIVDYTKGIHIDNVSSQTPRVWPNPHPISEKDKNGRAISLCSNLPLITAISNDVGYEYIFSEQLRYMPSYSNSDTCIAITASGNSPNIINGLKQARIMRMNTIALVGFNGGIILKENLADIIIHVNMDNYGIVEDTHHVIMHFITQQLRRELNPYETIIL